MAVPPAENRVEALVPSQIVLEQEAEMPSTIEMEKVKVEYTSVEEAVRAYFKDMPVMIRIAKCESAFRQVGKDGTILRGKVNKSDVGVMQINEYYHQKEAESLGLNLRTLEGNMAYAKHLYEREGSQPWISSSPCWNK